MRDKNKVFSFSSVSFAYEAMWESSLIQLTESALKPTSRVLKISHVPERAVYVFIGNRSAGAQIVAASTIEARAKLCEMNR